MKMPETIYFTLCFKAILFLFLHIFFFTEVVSSSLARNETDHLALIELKSKISNDPYGMLKSWNGSLHFCQWTGILCSRRRDRVISLDLSANYSLVGSLSPHIGNLSFLRELRLSNNKLQSSIPDEVGRLFRLRVLDLTNNSFQGRLSPNLSRCSNLSVLLVSENKLTGEVPVELASLSKLTSLRIFNNLFTGAFPSFIGNLTSLMFLSLAYNSFRGSIPESVGQLRSLRAVSLGGNEFFGKIPPSIYNISTLVAFSVANNHLEGNLPWDIGLRLPNLEFLETWQNNFSGQVPMTLSNASKLEHLDMANNSFSGKLAVPFGHLQNLVFLNLAANHLGSGEVDEMEFLTSLTNCTSLYLLEIGDNQFQGKLPHSIANLSQQLVWLYIGKSSLFGSIPPGLGNLVSLNSIALFENQFSGKIPEDIAQLKQLKFLDLSRNKLSEEIPYSLGNLTQLIFLYLHKNKLNGSLPSSLENCQNLNRLYLHKNQLNGSIPKGVFSLTKLLELSLSQNHLLGSLPPDVGNLRNLEALFVAENMLSGEIPSSLSGCTSLEIVQLRRNNFQGDIPSSISSMRGIRILDLSFNNLTGKIPQFMEKLSLEYLDVSFNNLEGEVPARGFFMNESAVSVGGNKKLCGGIPKLGLPECKNKALQKGKLSNVQIILISVSVSVIVVIITFFLLCWRKRKNEERCPSGFTMIEPLMQVSYRSLLKATNGFSSTNLLGKGSFGSVYGGVLEEDGTNIAVKVLDLKHQGASKSFMAECEALKNIRHRNLVKIITSCSSMDFQGNHFKALVYELMSNGSLESWLHSLGQDGNSSQIQVKRLNILQRIGIAIDVASAIDYLHHQCGKPIVHCDLKPSNVLLDNEMTAHVGDFGLAKFISEFKLPNQSNSIGVRGTIGYTAPEYGMGSEVSIFGDIYSYGILLLEMMTGKRPTDNLFEEGLNLHNYARMALPDRVVEIVDPNLRHEAETTTSSRQKAQESSKIDCLISMVKIGVACSLESPQDRMVTRVVLTELHLLRKNLLSSQANN